MKARRMVIHDLDHASFGSPRNICRRKTHARNAAWYWRGIGKYAGAPSSARNSACRAIGSAGGFAAVKGRSTSAASRYSTGGKTPIGTMAAIRRLGSAGRAEWGAGSAWRAWRSRTYGFPANA